MLGILAVSVIVCLGIYIIAHDAKSIGKSRARTVGNPEESVCPNPVTGIIEIGTTDVQELEDMKATLQHAKSMASPGQTHPGFADLEEKIDGLILEAKEAAQEQIRRELEDKLAQKDDVCPECGNTFALSDDYICADCRRRMG